MAFELGDGPYLIKVKGGQGYSGPDREIFLIGLFDDLNVWSMNSCLSELEISLDGYLDPEKPRDAVADGGAVRVRLGDRVVLIHEEEAKELITAILYAIEAGEELLELFEPESWRTERKKRLGQG